MIRNVFFSLKVVNIAFLPVRHVLIYFDLIKLTERKNRPTLFSQFFHNIHDWRKILLFLFHYFSAILLSSSNISWIFILKGSSLQVDSKELTLVKAGTLHVHLSQLLAQTKARGIAIQYLFVLVIVWNKIGVIALLPKIIAWKMLFHLDVGHCFISTLNSVEFKTVFQNILIYSNLNEKQNLTENGFSMISLLV